MLDKKLSKRSISTIAFFFNVGVIATGVVLGYFLPRVAVLVLAHPQFVLKCLMALGVFPVIWFLGQPVRDMLNRR